MSLTLNILTADVDMALLQAVSRHQTINLRVETCAERLLHQLPLLQSVHNTWFLVAPGG
jgi:hypothetical protein